MRGWRDIITAASLRDVVTAYGENPSLSSARNAGPRGVGLMLAVTQLILDIDEYHKIPKTDCGSLQRRREALKKIADLVDKVFVKYQIDQKLAEVRFVRFKDKDFPNRKPAKDPEIGWREGKPSLESLDRNLLTLKRRALRKRDYLQELFEYYKPERSHTAASLINDARNGKQETGNGLLGLCPGVWLERDDPLHRPTEAEWEVDPKTGAKRPKRPAEIGELQGGAAQRHDWLMADAFAEWWDYAEAQGDHAVPFFLWLEGHPISLAEDKRDLKFISGVAYGKTNLRTVSRQKLKRVYVDPQQVSANGLRLLVAVPVIPDGDPTPTICDTGTYQAAKDKEPGGGKLMGTGLAAYVWTKEREIWICDHRAGVFHHSSFKAGGQVRCAGMIRIGKGKIETLTTNSGHYRPRLEHFVNLVGFLRYHNALPPDAVISAPEAWQRKSGTAAQFLDDHKDLIAAAEKAAKDDEQKGQASSSSTVTTSDKAASFGMTRSSLFDKPVLGQGGNLGNGLFGGRGNKTNTQ